MNDYSNTKLLVGVARELHSIEKSILKKQKLESYNSDKKQSLVVEFTKKELDDMVDKLIKMSDLILDVYCDIINPKQ